MLFKSKFPTLDLHYSNNAKIAFANTYHLPRLITSEQNMLIQGIVLDEHQLPSSALIDDLNHSSRRRLNEHHMVIGIDVTVPAKNAVPNYPGPFEARYLAARWRRPRYVLPPQQERYDVR